MELRKNDTGEKEYCERRRQGKDFIVLFIVVVFVCLFYLSFAVFPSGLLQQAK